MLYVASTPKRRVFLPYLLAALVFVCTVPFTAFAQAPAVVSTGPVASSTTAPVTSDILVTFDEAMNVATFDASTFAVWGEKSGPHSGTFSSGSGGTVITFVPDLDFAHGELVTVTVSTGLESAAGFSPDQGFTWTFYAAAAGTGVGAFTDATIYDIDPNSYALTSADLDGDQDIDLVVVHRGGRNVAAVHLNDGSGGFALDSTYGVGSEPHHIMAADLNSDGYSDLTTANFGDGSISVLLNAGDGTFEPKIDYVVGETPIFVCASDLDGDGDLDMVTVDRALDSLHLLWNNGNGTFGGQVSCEVGNGPRAVSACDVNGDGAPDLITADGYGGGFTTLLNSGDGSLSLYQQTITGHDPYSVVTGDFDADGDPDLALCQLNSRNVVVRANDGTGAFVFDESQMVVGGPQSMIGADLDADGDLDIAAGCAYYDAYVAVLKNNGAADLDTVSFFQPDYQHSWITAADFDGDGDVDLATVTYLAGLLYVMENQSCYDPDGDGYGDVGSPESECMLDNCPGIYNPDQADNNDDGIGNACDPDFR